MSTAARLLLGDEGREEPDNLCARNPSGLAQEIVVDLESAFKQFCEIAADFVRNYWVTWQVAVVPGRRGRRGGDMRDFMWQGWRVVVNYCR
jgi:hypothetical protein